MRLTPHGARTHGALVTYCAPRLARDAKLPDLAGILVGAPTTNRVTQRAAIATAVKAAIGSRLAQDAELSDVAELLEAMERISEEEDGEDMEPNSAMPMVEPEDDYHDADDEHPAAAKIKEICEKHGVSPEVCNELTEAVGEHEAEGGLDSWDRRARDAARRMGRDETEEERERREEEEGAEDARRRMGRDEADDERRMRRAEDAARHAHRRARDAMRRMGRDARAEDRKRAEDALKRARDAHRRARDARAEDRRHRAEDARRHADDAKRRRAEDRKRAEDALREAEDAMHRMGRDARAEDRKRAEDRVRAAEDALRRARDAMEEPETVTKKEMTEAVDRAVRDARAHDQALYAARDYVRPWVGRLEIACDSAEQVYRAALRSLGHPRAEALHESALKDVLDLMAKPGAPRADGGARIAQDSANLDSARSFEKFYPGAAARH